MASTKGVYFNGRLITLPGAYSSVESTMTSTKSGSGAKVIALIGECTGGEPGTVQFFTEPSVAKKVLKSGELLKAAQKAWNPVSKTKEGVKLGGANLIACIRSNAATKGVTNVTQTSVQAAQTGETVETKSANTTGALTVSGTYGGVGNATYEVIITSEGVKGKADATYNWRYATESQQRLQEDGSCAGDAKLLDAGISVAFGDGNYTYGDKFLIPCTAAVTTTEAVYTIQSKDWGISAGRIQHKLSDGTMTGTKKLTLYDSKADTYEVYDNLGGMFSIKYKGDAEYAAISITSDGDGKSIKLQTFIGADAESAVVDIDIDLDVKIYKSIKAVATYLSGYADYDVTLYTSYNPELNVNDMDFMEKVEIKTASPVPITGVLPDLKKIVGFQSQLCEVTVINREVSNFADYNFTALVGGSEGISPMSWVDYFDMLARYNITYIVPLTDDLSIIAECQEHVNYMSDSMGKERRMMCGRGNRLTVEAAISDAMRLSHDLCQYIYPGMYDINDAGSIELYPAYILAAQHAGRAAFLPDGEAATHDHYKMSGIERELEPDEITKLLNGGVTTFEFLIADDTYTSSSVRMVQDITTYISDTDPLYVERAIGITADTLNKEIRKNLDELLVGKRTVTATLTTARNRIISILKQRVKDEIIVAYKDVNVYKEDGAVWVEYSVAPAEPTNFVLIKSHFYSEDLAAAGDTTTASSTL